MLCWVRNGKYQHEAGLRIHRGQRTSPTQLDSTNISIATDSFPTSTSAHYPDGALGDQQSLHSWSAANPQRLGVPSIWIYHARHAFRGWVKAALHRLLTHSSSPSVWPEECCSLYDHLRGCSRPLLSAVTQRCCAATQTHAGPCSSSRTRV